MVAAEEDARLAVSDCGVSDDLTRFGVGDVEAVGTSVLIKAGPSDVADEREL